MGIFDGFLDVVKPFLGLATGAVSGAASYEGQVQTNAANAEMAQKQMDFQERMSNTAYQRGTADMEKAGLNPMLAYSQGGASTAPGAMATMQNPVAPAMTSALASTQLYTELDKVKAETDESRSRALLNVDMASKARQDVQTGISSAGQADAARAKLLREIAPDVDLPYAEARSKHAGAEEAYSRQGILEQRMPYERSRARAEAQLKALDVPRAWREAEMYEGGAGGVIPYASSIAKGVGSAAQLKGMVSPKRMFRAY